MEKYYIAKQDSWFKTGTTVKLIDYMYNIGSEKFGNFEGTYVVQDEPYDKYWKNKGYKAGDEVVMTEICSYNEFEEHIALPDITIINKLAFEFTEIQIKQILGAYPNADINFDNFKFSFRAGFKAGFKYLDELILKDNENKIY